MSLNIKQLQAMASLVEKVAAISEPLSEILDIVNDLNDGLTPKSRRTKRPPVFVDELPEDSLVIPLIPEHLGDYVYSPSTGQVYTLRSRRIKVLQSGHTRGWVKLHENDYTIEQVREMVAKTPIKWVTWRHTVQAQEKFGPARVSKPNGNQPSS